MYHELTVWSRGIIMDREARDVSSGIAAGARALGRYADNASGYIDDPDRTNCLVHLVNTTREGRPEHIASIQIQAGRNRPDMGMDVPAELREGENPAKHLRLRKETYSMPLNRGVGD